MSHTVTYRTTVSTFRNSTPFTQVKRPLVFPGNLNRPPVAPRIPKKQIAKLVGGQILRKFSPPLAVALTAYDLYQAWHSVGSAITIDNWNPAVDLAPGWVLGATWGYPWSASHDAFPTTPDRWNYYLGFPLNGPLNTTKFNIPALQTTIDQQAGTSLVPASTDTIFVQDANVDGHPWWSITSVYRLDRDPAYPSPTALPEPMPEVIPQIRPVQSPFFRPVPGPMPGTWYQPNTHPKYHKHRAPKPAPKPKPNLPLEIILDPINQKILKISAGAGAGSGRTSQDKIKRRERKTQVRGAGYQVLKRVADGLGEIVEWIDILSKSAGWRYDRFVGGGRMYNKVHYLFLGGGLQNIDFDDLLANIVLNEIEDRFYAGLGNMGKTAAQNLNLTVGAQTGSFMRRSQI